MDKYYSSLKSFADEENEKRKLNRCKICQLPIDLLNEVNEALINNSIARTTICRWLGTLGHSDIVKSTIAAHYDHFIQQTKNIPAERTKRTKSS